ncbi:ABC transporter substrate-binding protein [Tissierella sp. Yu-01]|uniref:ABC transporter substrate-binding protein n=1 Tax=Tissierella sp. Yu-01 TaxID=3035694 RepID=UPI00240E768E|nr:ABC transporter substrate-binding protein [Tissierella sp. Yu-01]WFA10140.1 ABC transporter substrate-binding protein [Tissierella sp. Yu-01]
MKKLTALLLALVLVVGLVGCTSEPTSSGNSSNEEDVIYIGMLASLTGGYATQGEYAKHSAEIAVEEINEAGGVLGKKIEVIIEDDLGTDEGAINAYNKLASNDGIVGIIGSGYSTLNLAVNSAAERAEILTTAQGSNDKLGYLNNPWHFQMRTADSVQVTAGIRYAVEELGVKNWAILNATDAASVGQAEVTKATLGEYGITPKLELSYNEGTQDFTSHLVQIQEAGVDAIFSAGNAVEGALLMTQYKQLGLDAIVIGSNAYSSAQMLELAGAEVMEGIYSATHYTPETPRERGAAYTQAYFDKTGVVADAAGALVYDHVYLIAEAVEKAGSTDRTEVRDAFLTIENFDGAVTDYTVTTEGGSGTSAMLVQNDNNGGKKVIDVINVVPNK